MIRIFVCPQCGKTRVVSKFLKAECYQCGAQMKPMDISYTDWVELPEKEREVLARDCRTKERDKRA